MTLSINPFGFLCSAKPRFTPLSQPAFFERLSMAAIVAQQIRWLQFSKTILKRLLRFTAVLTSFENMMVSLLDNCFRCPAAVEP
ncbi:MAG: hypothetical protein ACYCYL_06370 [Acidithiobacillus sp.]